MEAVITRDNNATERKDFAALLCEIVDNVSRERFGGNVYAQVTSGPRSTSRRHYVRFVLRCHDSRGEGARRAASGRRTNAATWEAHEHCIRALFEQWGDRLRIATALATYNGPADFERTYVSTYSAQVGSLAAPAMFGDL